MIKAILLDGDGVVLQGRERYFSQVLAEEKGIDHEVILPFFKNEYRQCVLGNADLKTEVEKYLKSWKWDKSVDALLEYWFSLDGAPSKNVLQAVEKMKKKGVKIYLASDHTAYRKNDMMQRMGLNTYFDGAFFSCDLGATKDDLDFYRQAIEQLGLQPEEILFWDDEEENIETAKKAGVDARLYEDFGAFEKALMEENLI